MFRRDWVSDFRHCLLAKLITLRIKSRTEMFKRLLRKLDFASWIMQCFFSRVFYRVSASCRWQSDRSVAADVSLQARSIDRALTPSSQRDQTRSTRCSQRTDFMLSCMPQLLSTWRRVCAFTTDKTSDCQSWKFLSAFIWSFYIVNWRSVGVDYGSRIFVFGE